MAELRINNNMMTQPTIGSSSVYTEQVRNRINKKIGGVYSIGTEYRNANLMNNPMTLRYKNHENAQGYVSGDDIGQIYRVNDKKGLNHFLDEEKGLVGFTFGDETTKPGFENNTNTGVKTNFDAVRQHQGDLFTENYKYLYDVEQHVGVEPSGFYEGVLDRIDKTYLGGDYSLFRNLTPEQGTLAKIDEAVGMARKTLFKRNGTKVVERYMTNGGGFKFDARYTTAPGFNYAFGGRDVSGLKNRITQLYADVFGLPDNNINPFNRFIDNVIYNPALPLNPISDKSLEIRRYNPLPNLAKWDAYELYSVDDKKEYSENQIFYKENVGNGISADLDGNAFSDLNKLNGLYNRNNLFDDGTGTFPNLSREAVEAIEDAKQTASLGNEPYVGKERKFDETYVVDSPLNSIRNLFNPLSVDNPIDTSDFGDTVEPRPIYGGKNPTEGISPKTSTVYNIYDERNSDAEQIYEKSKGESNYSDNIVVDLIDTDGDNNNSLLKKTNALFQQGKIHSIINRFHTDVSNQGLTESASDYIYNLSRGRNLRKKNVTYPNGYEDPYCRVWTSHYQYSKMKNLIRNSGYEVQDKLYPLKDGLRPNNGATRLNDFSTLQDNGLPLIAPYRTADLDKTIKKYMFSIENLAWKDALKKDGVLSKEQRGPNGGRIMWFPPYNLKFNENVSTNWQGNAFIGRGEQIYTYTNTERSGTLSFTLLIDHPSVLDSWVYGKQGGVNEEDEQTILRFFAGCDDGDGNSDGNSVSENEIGDKTNEEEKTHVPVDETPELDNTPVPESAVTDASIHYFVFFPNDFSGIDYINSNINAPMEYLYNGKVFGVNGYEMGEEGLKGCLEKLFIEAKNRNKGTNKWYYQVDKSYEGEVLKEGNYEDRKSFKLNKDLPSLLEGENGQTIKTILHIQDDDIPNIHSFADLYEGKDDFSQLSTFFSDESGTVQDNEVEISVDIRGYASSHGYQKNNAGTSGLSGRRARVIKKFLSKTNMIEDEKINVLQPTIIEVTNADVSSLEAKLGRCAEVIVRAHRKDKTPRLDTTTGNEVKKENNEQNKVEETKDNVRLITSASTVQELRTARYDEEYNYFQKVNETDDMVKKYIVDKVQYFDPAFHSITPEGFNGRLTFLHQCTRQGPTSAQSDLSGSQPKFAGNLAFGRPPVCVLRIGDFFNTKIIIDSLSINYDNGGITWDLNPEGAGVQPMIANIDITFKFLGGSDISGPIARLQNAVSFNYYANASVYDKRADYRPENYISENDDTARAWDVMTDSPNDFRTINNTNNNQ